MAMRPPAAPDTKARLIEAAAACFAERGFQGATIREIADRAGVNVAAGHYHVGSKKELYLAVLRAQFAHVRSALAAQGAEVRPDDVARLPRGAVETLLHRRVLAMLRVLLGPPPSLHGTLMQREMCDPGEAMPMIVAELIRPFLDEMEAVIRRLAPELERAAVERAVCSIAGQVLFYRFAMPAVLRMWGLAQWDAALTPVLARHVTEFSLGGLGRLAGQAARAGRTARRRASGEAVPRHGSSVADAGRRPRRRRAVAAVRRPRAR